MTHNLKNRARVWMLAGIAAASVALSPMASTVAQAKEPLKIGFSMALTGALAGGGKQSLEAMKIWASDVNAKGGLLGRQVELVYYDDQTNAKNVPGIYSKLLDVDKVDLVVSGYGTNLIGPAMPVVIDRDIVFMGLFGMDNNKKWKYEKYFQILPAGPEPAVGFSHYWFEALNDMKPRPKTIALLAADAEFARNLKEGAEKNAKKYGFEIVYNQNYPPKTADFTPIVRAVNATNPDVFYIASYPNGSAGMVRALAEVGTKARAVGGGMVGLQFSGLMAGLGPNLRHHELRLLRSGTDDEPVSGRERSDRPLSEEGQGRRPEDRRAGLLPGAVGLCLPRRSRSGCERGWQDRPRSARCIPAQDGIHHRRRQGEIRPERRVDQEPYDRCSVSGHQE